MPILLQQFNDIQQQQQQQHLHSQFCTCSLKEKRAKLARSSKRPKRTIDSDYSDYSDQTELCCLQIMMMQWDCNCQRHSALLMMQSSTEASRKGPTTIDWLCICIGARLFVQGVFVIMLLLLFWLSVCWLQLASLLPEKANPKIYSMPLQANGNTWRNHRN